MSECRGDPNTGKDFLEGRIKKAARDEISDIPKIGPLSKVLNGLDKIGDVIEKGGRLRDQLNENSSSTASEGAASLARLVSTAVIAASAGLAIAELR